MSCWTFSCTPEYSYKAQYALKKYVMSHQYTFILLLDKSMSHWIIL